MPELPKYGGIKKKFPVLRGILQRIIGEKLADIIAAWLLLLRPFTLFAPLTAGVFGVLAAVDFNTITAEHVKIAILAGTTLAMAQVAGQVINQCVDKDLDARAKPYRAIPRGDVSGDEAMGFAWLLVIFAIGLSFIIGVGFGIFVLTLIFFAVFYSLPPLSPRRINPFLNHVWVSFSRGFLPVLAVTSVYGDISISGAWTYAVFAFLWCMAYQGSKDVADAEYDKGAGIKTIVNTYGVKGFIKYAAGVSMILYIYAYQFIPIMLLLAPFTILFFEGLEKQSEMHENTRAWIWYYAGLGMIYVIMFLKESAAWL